MSVERMKILIKIYEEIRDASKGASGYDAPNLRIEELKELLNKSKA